MPGLEKLITNFVKTLASIFFILFILVVVLLLSGLNGDDSDMFLIGIVLFAFLAFVSLLIAIVYSIAFVVSYSKAKARLRNIPCFSEERFEREVKRAPKMKNVVLCSDAICVSDNGGFIKVIPIEEIIWAYQGDDNSGSYLQLYMQDRSEFKLSVVIKRKIGTADMAYRYILRLITRKSPGVIIGYGEEHEAVRKHNFEQMVARVKFTKPVDSRLLEMEYQKNNYYVMDFH